MKNLRLGRHCTIAALAMAFVMVATLRAGLVQSQTRDSQKPQDASTLRIETELVQIDVVVTDKDGKLVTDLKREEFQLLEDGKPQNITHFSIGTATRQANWLRTSPIATNKNAPVPPVVTPPPLIDTGRYLVLAVDDIHLKPGNLMLAKQTLTKFIDQQLGVSDQVALITTSGQVGMFQQFTENREALRRAVNRLSVAARSVTNNFDVPRITPYHAELIDNGDLDALELPVQELIAKFNMDRRQAVAESQARARAIIQENRYLTMNTLTTIENIVKDLRGLSGRKILVLLSDGFLLGGQREGVHFDLRRITDAATRAGVVIYSIDARGLVAMPDTMDASSPGFFGSGRLAGVRLSIENSSIQAERDGMYALAEDTGGKAIFNNNDLNFGLQQVMNDTESYYLLAFEPTVSYRDGRFRKLEVRVTRPGLKVRTRKGYFAPDDKAAEKAERELAKAAEKDKNKTLEKLAAEAKTAANKQIVSGLASLFQRREVPIETAVTFLNEPPRGVQTDIVAHIETYTIRFKPSGDRQTAKLELVGVVYRENGKEETNFMETLSMNLKPNSHEAALKNGITYTKRLQLKPGFYQLRMVARDDGGAQVGTASNWFEVPDLDKRQLTLSSVFFPLPNQLEAQTVDPNRKRETTEPIPESQVPARPPIVYRRFKSGGSFDFMIFAYNAKSNDKGATDLAIQTQVYSGNQLIVASPLKNFSDDSESLVQQTAATLQPASDAGRAYMARFSLDKFKAGEYELRLVVIDRNAKTSAKRSINFTVE
jgi:VWFA-related protein